MSAAVTIDQRHDVAERVRGGILGGLIGDAMGAATEMRTPRQIVDRYGWVDAFLPPEAGTFADGRGAARITDDSMVSLLVIDTLIATAGSPTSTDAAEIILTWASDASVLRFAGPSTQRSIRLLKAGSSPEEAGTPNPTDNDLRASNGAAMKAAPAGYAAVGDIYRAVTLATVFAVPTHNSDIAFSGAGAVAAAVSTACSGASLDKVLASAIEGAELGLEEGRRNAIEVPGPSVAKRIQLALDIASGVTRWEPTATNLGDIIGAGLPIAEAVPLAVGLVRLTEGDVNRAIQEAVNLGDDADTVATIAGAIAGAYAGAGAVDVTLSKQVLEVNNVDLDRLVRGLLDLQGL